MGTKGILLSVVAVSLFAFQKTYEHLGGDISSESAPYRQAEIAAILNGADPTDILAPAAAGNSSPKHQEHQCRFGNVIGEDKARKLDDQFYVSFTKDNVTYIQVSPLIPTYLKQDNMQTVTAQAVTPDEEVRNQLNDLFTRRDTCVTADLYLQRVSSL
jgi:hypothetical protein